MKRLICKLLGVCMVFFGGHNISAQTDINGKKILIAYYSHSGNTKEIAEAIQKKMGGDLFEITTNHRYPDEYDAMTKQVKAEINRGFKPELRSKVTNISQYDVIFVGSPNWWGTIAPAVSSFLEICDLDGKTVIPFVTHGGGGKQRTFTDFAAQCSRCNVEKCGWVGSGNSTKGLDTWIDDFKNAAQATQ